MERDPVILRTLTIEEKESIPQHVLQKIQIEIKNLHNIHQTAVSTLKKKINETETLLIEAQSQIKDFKKKINQCELEKHIQYVECSVLKSKLYTLERENSFLSNVIKKNKPMTNNTTKKDFENKKKTIEGLIDSIVCADNNQSKSLEEYEKINRRLTNKVNDLKKQLDYLLDSSDDSNQQKQNLIRMIQTLSRENDRLNEMKAKGVEIENFTRIIDEQNIKIKDLEDRLAICIERENHVVFEEQKKFLNEIELLAREKNNLYDQFMALYSFKIDLENKYNELEEDLRNKNEEIRSLISKQRNFDQLLVKYNEVSNELIRSNIVVRDYRLKIIDLTKKLEESEERYSTYILSNRTDIIALLGRELGYMRKRITTFADDFNEITHLYNEYKEEQDLLTEMYKSKCNELEDHRVKLSKFENQQIILNDILNVIPNEMRFILNGLYEMYNDICQNAAEFISYFEKTIDEHKTTIFILNHDLNEKEQIIKSLIENNMDVVDSFIKHENNMLKNEIVLLNAKLDNLQSEEYTDVIGKLEQIRSENENIREYVTNLNSEILKKEHTIRNLEDNLLEINEKLEIKEVLISKYEKIIEKLRKVKDAYVKLKRKRIEQESIPEISTSPSFKYLDTPPNKEKTTSDILNVHDENDVINKKRTLPLLSTENFVISENSGDKTSKNK